MKKKFCKIDKMQILLKKKNQQKKQPLKKQVELKPKEKPMRSWLMKLYDSFSD